MLSKLICTCFWICLHILYTIYENILSSGVYFNLKIKEIRRLKRFKDDAEFISDSMKCLLKRPEHVVLILDEYNLSYGDLAKLIIWSLIAGISYFSIYDTSGILYKNEDKLVQAVQKLKENVPGHIKWTSRPDLNGYTNGNSKKMTISLLTIDDGKRKIVSVVKSLCDNTKRGELDPNLIDVCYLDSELGKLSPFPDPNLAIFCGSTCRTNGLLPWHIRLTEFLYLGSHRCVKIDKFMEILQRYGRCQQRFGK